MKLNIGCGTKKFEGFINIDDDPTIDPDLLLNLDDVNIRLPYDDNTVEEIKAYHVLEHIGLGFIPLLKELYRVAKDGCIVDIIAPNERHDVFFGDPTHVRPINASIFATLAKSHPYGYLGRKYDIDFEITEALYDYDDFYKPLIANFNLKKIEGSLTNEEDFFMARLQREANNLIIENHIKLRFIK